MNELDNKILELAKSGLSGRKIRKALPEATEKQVRRVIRDHIQAGSGKNSQHNPFDHLRPHIMWYLVEGLGKDPKVCEICNEHQEKTCDIHHTKYEGATIYDLQFVCRSCNLAKVNKGLA